MFHYTCLARRSLGFPTRDPSKPSKTFRIVRASSESVQPKPRLRTRPHVFYEVQMTLQKDMPSTGVGLRVMGVHNWRSRCSIHAPADDVWRHDDSVP